MQEACISSELMMEKRLSCIKVDPGLVIMGL